MKQIVLASNNPGKLKELQEVLKDFDLSVIPQSEFSIPDADETGLTFVENAIIKARHAAELSGLPAIADDSGIEVDALKGVPGIYSARYAGPKCDNNANNDKLLEALKDVPEAERTARYQCLIVYMQHPKDPTPLICQGTWEGRILLEPVGNKGFGYDPLFFVPSHNCSSAELNPVTKNQLSHRGQAIRKLMAELS